MYHVSPSRRSRLTTARAQPTRKGRGDARSPRGAPTATPPPPYTHTPPPSVAGRRGRPGAHSPGRWGIRPRCAPCGSRRSRRCGPGPGRAGRGRHALRPRRAGRAGSAGRGGADTAQNAEGGTGNGVPGQRGNMERIPRLKDREPETDKARSGAFPGLGVEAAVVPRRKWRGESFGSVSRSERCLVRPLPSTVPPRPRCSSLSQYRQAGDGNNHHPGASTPHCAPRCHFSFPNTLLDGKNT